MSFMKYLYYIVCFFILNEAVAQNCPPGSSFALSDSTCGQILPGVTVSCGSIAFCVSDSIGITTSSAIPFDSVFVCWGDGTTDTVAGNISSCLYHKYNFKKDSCLGNGNNFLNPTVTVFYIKHCALGYSSNTFNTYPKVKFMPNTRFGLPDSICVGSDLPINILGCANADLLDTTFITWDMGNGVIYNLYTVNGNVTTPSPFYQYPNAGTFTVTLTMTNSCGTTSNAQVVNIKPKPILNPVLTDFDGCTPDSLSVQVNSQFTNTYGWNWNITPGAGIIINSPTDSQPDFLALNSGTYNFEVTVSDNTCCSPTFNGNWCTWSDSITFFQGSSFNYTPISDTCVAWPVNYNLNIGQYLLFGTANTDSSWQLMDGNTPVVINSAGIANITDTGTYTLTISAWNTCDTVGNNYTFFVNTPPPNPNLLTDTTVCVNAALVDLNAIANPIVGYWTQNGALINPAFYNPSLATNSANNLIFTVGPVGCDITDTLTINVVGIGTTAGPDQNICSNSNTLNLSLNAIPAGGTWSGDGITNSAAGTFDPDSAINAISVIVYTVNIGNCVINDTLLITNNAPPAAAFIIPNCICANASATFSDTVSNTIATWDFGDLTPPVTANTTNHTYTTAGNYTVTLAIENTLPPFCKDTIRQLISVNNIASAVFSSSTDTTCSNQPVTFTTIAAIDTNYSYLWDFGDGKTDTVYNPIAHSYPTDTIIKTYYVQLQVTSCCGIVTYIDSVIVNPSPDAGFAIINTTGCSPDTVYFYDFSSGTPDNFTLYINGLATPILPYYVLTTSSNADSVYEFMLVAANECGADTMIVRDTIHPGTIKALFNATPTKICVGETVTFVSVTSLLVSNTGVLWDFGDGNIASADTVTHKYNVPGTYTAWLHVYNCGIDSVSKTITVYAPPQDSFAVAAINCINQPVVFNNLSTAVGYSWNFGDGSPLDSLVNPAHLYAATGVYQVALVSININGCRDTFKVPITIVSAPAASFTIPNNQVCEGKPISLSGTSTGALFYNWDMGNGTQLTAPPPLNYTYPDTGTFIVTLTVSDANNCADDTTFSYVYIRPNADAFFTYSQQPLCSMPSLIQFTNQSSNAISYKWYFGATDSSAQTNPSLTFNTDTTFTTLLIANNLYNCPGTFSLPIISYAAPDAVFSASDTIICPGESVSFLNNSSSNADSYQWYFGNGLSSVLENPPVQLYAQQGSYTVTLIVGNDGICFDTLSIKDYIKVYSKPQADFNYKQIDSVVNNANFSPSGYYQFNSLSSNASKLLWNFGDGKQDSVPNPLHLYYSSGEKCVTLIAFNNDDCTDTIVKCFILELPGTLYLPNSITPDNGNEQERSFYAKGTAIANYKLEIFSPFGELIWTCEENGPFINGESQCRWNGNDTKGNPAPQGAYVWKVSGTFENGNKLGSMSKAGELKTVGSIMVIR